MIPGSVWSHSISCADEVNLGPSEQLSSRRQSRSSGTVRQHVIPDKLADDDRIKIYEIMNRLYKPVHDVELLFVDVSVFIPVRRLDLDILLK